MPRTVSLKALAEALAPERAARPAALKVSLSRWASAAGLPCTRTPSGPLFDLDEARAWLLAHKPPRVAPELAAAPQPSAPPAREPSPEEAALAAVLRSASASAVERSRAAFKLACIELARGVDAGLPGRSFDAVERQSKELRQAEADFIELGERRGELIERETAIAVIGECVQRLLGLHDRLQNECAQQAEIWRTDPRFEALGAEERAREWRAWLEARSADLRGLDAQTIDTMLDADNEEAER